LIDYGFRLPSAADNRPLKYPEFEKRIGPVIYTSATPSEVERTTSEQIVEQIIRPTGLIDPEIVVRAVSAVFSPLLDKEGAGGGNSKNHHLALKGTPPQQGGEDKNANNS
jgi:excinuclease ABC subunit B